MSDAAECAECQAILEELRAALAEIGASPRLASDLRAGRDAFFKMMGGAEEDVEEALRKYPFRPQLPEPGTPVYWDPRIGAVVRRLLYHRGRTGHNILSGKWPG